MHRISKQYPITFFIDNKSAMNRVSVLLKQFFKHVQIVFFKGEKKLLHDKDWRRDTKNQIVNTVVLIINFQNAVALIFVQYPAVELEGVVFDDLKMIHNVGLLLLNKPINNKLQLQIFLAL